MAISKLNLTSTALAVVMSVSLASFATTASAGKGGNNPNKQGPRSSVDVQTTCALDGTMLNVTVDVSNKNSDAPIAELDAYSIAVVYKSFGMKGNETADAGLGGSSDKNKAAPVTITKSYNLCDAEVDSDLRAINVDTSVTYGLDDGNGGVADARTVINSCSDDPATAEVEPAGIKISYDELATACAAP